MILDLTQCSDRSFWEALERFPGSVHASHNTCRALVPQQRQFSGEQIRAIAERGGVIGAALDCWMLVPGWRHRDDNQHITLNDMVNHVDHICQLVGTCRHVGIGTDLDGVRARGLAP